MLDDLNSCLLSLQKRDDLIARIAHALFCLSHSNRGQCNPNGLKRSNEAVASCWGTSAKRHKPSTGMNNVRTNGIGYPLICGNAASGMERTERKSQKAGRRAPSDWYVLKSTQGRQGYWHRKVDNPRLMHQPTLTQDGRYTMKSLSLIGHSTVKPEIGLPYRFGKKWRPRGYFPKFCSTHGPHSEAEDGPPELGQTKNNGVQKMDLSITGTNGYGSNGLMQSGEEKLRNLATKILNQDILARFGLACDLHGSSDIRETAEEENNVPRLDLMAPITMDTMESEQVPSSASDFSMDFDSLAETEATVACSSRQQDPQSSLQNSEDRSRDKETSKAGSGISDSRVCGADPKYHPTSCMDSSRADQGSGGMSSLESSQFVPIQLPANTRGGGQGQRIHPDAILEELFIL